IAATQYVDGFQLTAVTAFITLTMLGSETPRVHDQTVDLFGGDHGTGEGFRQQATVVVAEHRQYRTLIAIGHYGLGEACLDRCTGLGHITFYVAIVIDHKEVDTASAGTAVTTVQAHTIHTKGIHSETYGALGKAGLVGQYRTLAPFGLVLVAVLVITADIGVAQKQIKAAVFNKAGGICLAC